jgi:hypothetical protein
MLFWCFGKKSFLVESWNIWLNFSTFSVGLCYFFENWLRKLKCQNLLKPLGTIIYQNSQFYHSSEPFSFHHFNVRHPVHSRRAADGAYGDLGTGHYKVLANTWTLFQSGRSTHISTKGVHIFFKGDQGYKDDYIWFDLNIQF